MIGMHQKYIEQNIELIENDEWEEFFQHGPNGLGEVLLQAGIDFMLPLKRVPSRSFAKSNVTYVNIPEGVEIIDHIAFNEAVNLKSITIPNSIVKIGNDAFSHCRSLEHIELPNSVTEVGQRAFAYCHSLTSVVLSDGLTFIHKGTFFDCSNLKHINIPATVTYIDKDAFSFIEQLEINYNGTTQEWKKLVSRRIQYIFNNTKYICKCTDGVVKR